MGTWGTRIYEDDTALDVRHEFFVALDMAFAPHEPQAGDAILEIEDQIYLAFEDDDEYSRTVVTLALCCAELETGTLTDRMKKEALHIIASGRAIDLWEEYAVDPSDTALRKHELTLIRKYIEKYDGKPVKRKSWLALQKHSAGDGHEVDAQNTVELGEKLDDVGWHMVNDPPKGVSDDTFERYAGAHIATFLYWLYTRGYHVTDSAWPSVPANKLREGKLSPIDLLLEGDGKLFSGEVTVPVRPFVEAYYRGGRKSYLVDYFTWFGTNKDPYTFEPTTEDYERIAKKIDECLLEYQAHPYGVSRAWYRTQILKIVGLILLGLIWLVGSIYLLTR